MSTTVTSDVRRTSIKVASQYASILEGSRRPSPFAAVDRASPSYAAAGRDTCASSTKARRSCRPPTRITWRRRQRSRCVADRIGEQVGVRVDVRAHYARRIAPMPLARRADVTAGIYALLVRVLRFRTPQGHDWDRIGWHWNSSAVQSVWRDHHATTTPTPAGTAEEFRDGPRGAADFSVPRWLGDVAPNARLRCGVGDSGPRNLEKVSARCRPIDDCPGARIPQSGVRSRQPANHLQASPPIVRRLSTAAPSPAHARDVLSTCRS